MSSPQGKDAMQIYPYSCVDGLEKVTPFKSGYFQVFLLNFGGYVCKIDWLGI